jgi:hypothetical protein
VVAENQTHNKIIENTIKEESVDIVIDMVLDDFLALYASSMVEKSI